MSSHHHHNPRSAYLVDPLRKRCPVCNQSVYSRGGVHPQCAIKLADAPPIGSGTPSAVAPDSTGEVADLDHEP
jgi:hypothetical protein